ncbi:MAG TPA: SCP2 sterol-binding domain-containing protein [Candidatus Dormibacteraeota bacterium]|nr:SCP2 sterol-binding domain-containing protein [Candidatus Dormibacteraeota bacterium]
MVAGHFPGGEIMSENGTPGQPQAGGEAPSSASTETAAPATEQPSTTGQGGQPSAADLVGLVGDKTDDALVSMINEHGVDTFIGGIFEEMAKRFLPDKAAGRTAVIEYDITMPESTEIYQLDVAGGACSVSKGASKEASVALTLAAPDFLRLITGKLNGVNAFMSGKLKLKGDMMLAQTMQGWFDAS